MLLVLSPIFVADIKIISVLNFILKKLLLSLEKSILLIYLKNI